MRPVHFACSPRPTYHRDSSSGRVRDGRGLIEVVLIILVPCLLVAIFCLCDAEVRRGLLSKPPGVPLRLMNPITGAVRVDGERAMTVHQHGQMRLWDFSQSAELGEMQCQIPEVSCIAYAEQSRLLAVGSKLGQLEIWNLDHPQAPEVIEHAAPGQIHDCQFTPDGQTLLTATVNGQISVWDPQKLTRRATWQSPTTVGAIRCLAVSSDGQFVLAGTFLGVVQVWSLQSGQLLRSHAVSLAPRPGHADAAAISAVTLIPGDREFIAATQYQGVSVWNVQTGAPVRQLEGVPHWLKNAALSPDGRRLTAGMVDGEVITWDIVTGRRTGAALRHPTSVTSLLYSTDGKTLLTGDSHGQVLYHRD